MIVANGGCAHSARVKVKEHFLQYLTTIQIVRHRHRSYVGHTLTYTCGRVRAVT